MKSRKTIAYIILSVVVVFTCWYFVGLGINIVGRKLNSIASGRTTCWFGVCIGDKISPLEAKGRLLLSPTVVASSISQTDHHGSVTIHWYWRGASRSNKLYINADQSVRGFRITPKRTLTLGTVIANFGNPEAIKPRSLHGEGFSSCFEFKYPAKGLTFTCCSTDAPQYAAFNQETTVTSVSIGTEYSLEEIYEKQPSYTTYPWLGYGVIDPNWYQEFSHP